MPSYDYTWIEGGEQVYSEDDQRLADLTLNEKRGNGRVHVYCPDNTDTDNTETTDLPF